VLLLFTVVLLRNTRSDSVMRPLSTVSGALEILFVLYCTYYTRSYTIIIAMRDSDMKRMTVPVGILPCRLVRKN